MVSVCPPGWILMTSKCILYVDPQWSVDPVMDPDEVCIREGGRLVLIDTPDLADLLHLHQPQPRPYYIGLRDANVGLIHTGCFFK